MLPHIAGRALSLVRLPNGIGGESFYQKNVSSTLPPGFDSIPVPDKKTGEIHQYVSLNTAEAIASMAQMSVLEVHPWGSLADDLEHPDRLVIDLDPDESLPWSTLTAAAADVREHLKLLKLESFLKTTGGKGLHVVIPIAPDLAYPEIKQFCHGFVEVMERSNPRLYLTKMTKAARAGKIYLDYLRNERGATAVAPYSPRARANVGVAVPLEWSELSLSRAPGLSHRQLCRLATPYRAAIRGPRCSSFHSQSLHRPGAPADSHQNSHPTSPFFRYNHFHGNYTAAKRSDRLPHRLYLQERLLAFL